MIIIDSNILLGHWPYRKLCNNTAKEIVGLMDEHKIKKGIISSLNSIFYRNSHEGNKELFTQIKNFKNRFIMFGVINPAYVNWKEDLKECVQKFNINGLNIYPNYHNYKLNDRYFLELTEEAQKYKLPVALTCAFEDPRQRHWTDNISNIQDWEIIKAINSSPNTAFIVHNSDNPLRIAEFLKNTAGKALNNFLFDNAFVFGPPSDNIEQFIKKIGAEHLILGTNTPFRYTNNSLLKIQALEINAKAKNMIFSGNLLKLLK